MVAPVKRRAGVGCAAELLEGAVLVCGDPGGVPVIPSPPGGAQEHQPGEKAEVHG